MSTFKFKTTVPAPSFMSTALGVTGDANHFKSAYDIGKPVILGTAHNHVLATAGAEIAGFVASIEPFTVNGNFSFGSIQTEGWAIAIVGANQGATPMAVGDFVVADTQLALGTVGANQSWTDYPGTIPSLPTGPTAKVKTGTPSKKLWEVMEIITGTGVAGDEVLLRRE